jgi:hypothetical protein
MRVLDHGILVSGYFKFVLSTMGPVVLVNPRMKLPQFPPLPHVAGVPWSEPLPQQGLVAWSAIDMDTYVSAYVVFRVVTLNPATK